MNVTLHHSDAIELLKTLLNSEQSVCLYGTNDTPDMLQFSVEVDCVQTRHTLKLYMSGVWTLSTEIQP